MLPAIPTHVPFNIEDPRRRSFRGPLQGRKNILEEGDPDRLQYDINIVAAIYCPPLIILALPVFLNYMLRLASFD